MFGDTLQENLYDGIFSGILLFQDPPVDQQFVVSDYKRGKMFLVLFVLH